MAKVAAKIVQMSEMKKKYAVFRMLSIKVGHGGAAATKKAVS